MYVCNLVTPLYHKHCNYYDLILLVKNTYCGLSAQATSYLEAIGLYRPRARAVGYGEI